MEKKGVRVDVKRLEELDKTLDNKIKTLEKEIYKLAGVEFKIRSSKKLESVLFNKMKLRHKTGLNNLSGTNSKTLRMLERKGAEIAGKILRFRSLDKLKSGVKGCIDKVDEHDGRIHTDFLTTKTKTGRLSLKDPNLQSIPNRDEEARFIRQAFIAEEGHKLISADYSQMELRILAEIANVKKFKEAFSKGEDIHAITAKQVFGRDDGKFRQKAKAINFGIIYGMSEYQLAKELEVSTQEAKTYIEKYYKEYPEIEEYKRNTVVYGRVNHYVETFSGRRINTEYINSRIIPVKEHYRRVAVNARIQGTSADIMRLAMIKLSKELKEKNLGEIINTIHDELIVEAEDGKAEEVQKLMKEMMEKTAKEIIGVDVPVKINVGDDLNFGKELNEDQQETRDHLQENDDFTMSYDDLGYNSLLQEDEEETNDFINNYDLEEEEYRNSCFDILGIEYQVLVSMLCFHRAFSVHGKKYKNLSLATEEDQKKVGKYDDIVIRYIDKEDKKKAINVQVKRIDEEEGYNEIYCTTLFPQGEGKNKDMFAINKYFMSFLEQDKERRDETKYNVIFTNSDLATKDGKKVKYKLLKHSGIEVDEIRDEVLEDLLCANKEQPGFYNFSKGEVREKILKVIDPLQSESRKKVKRILEESTLSKIGIEKIEELLNSPSGKKEKEIKKLIEEVKEQLKPLEKVTKENVLVLLKPLFAAKKFTEKEYKKLIDDFFNKLVLAVNQPNRQELKMIVKKEIEEKIVENNDSSKVFNDFEKKMFGWLEKRIENEGIRITKENSGNYFREINKNADKGINTVTYREDKRYKKTPWVGAMVPRIVYIWELLTFYIYKAFLANKNDKDYEELSIKIGEKRTGENNYTCFNYKDKCTCISFEYKDIREGSREEIFTSIDDHYDYFLKLRKEKKKLEHFVVSVEGFELEEGCDFIGENELKRINFQGKGDHKLLENFFLCEGKEKEGSFYRFSEETIRKLLDKTDEEHKKEKKAFLEILVFKVNLPGREKLESSIQSEIGGEENYYNLKELVLRWIEGPMGMSIDNKIKEEYLKDIKDGKVSKLTYEMAEENKGLIGPIDSFVRTIVGRGEARRFRGFKAFLLNKGVDKFKALISNQALPHISSMLLGVREDCDSSFERLYDKLFDKKGKEKEFLKSFTSSGITLGNVSGMLHGAGSKAPEALETLIETLTKERTINGKNTTYLKFLKDNGILSNVSSMLGSAGSKAPEALETLIETLTKERTINGENTTYLKFLKDNGILSNVSSMLGSAGSKAPEALETLIETLTKERTINGKNTTYLKFLKDNGILSNVSSMLGSAGSKAPEALETLIETLTKERTINGENTTYLKFLKDNGILSNVSGMLHGAGSKAPEALETLIETLTKERTINGENTTYLKFLKDKGILSNVSGMLHGAGSKAPEALETLIETLTKERTINGKNTTYLKFLKDKGILSNVFGMLSRAGSQTHYLLRMFCDALNMKIDENNELTYLDAFLRDRVMQEVFRDLKEEKRLKNPDNLKEFFDLELEKLTTEEYTFITAKGASFALKKLCGALGREEDGGKKILEFFRKNNITVSISGMTTGITARKELLDTSQKMKEKLTEERTINGKNTTYLKFLKDKGILSNVSGMLHGAGSKAPETLETLIETLTKKINGKNTTYLKFLKDKGILSNVSSMLSRAGSQAPEALETLIETLTKERTINEKNTTYLKFLKDKGILSNVSGMLHGAGSKAPEALETLIETLTKERTINGKKTTYLKFLKDKGILSNVSGMLHGRSKAPEALEGSLDALNLKIDGQQGKKTYLECFSEKGITNEVIIGSLREWKKQRSEDYNKRFENYFDRRLKNLTEKNASSQENISSQQQSDKRKLKGSEESTAQNYSKKKKANTEVSSGCSDEERQEVVSCLSEFILNNLPDASVKSVRQGLYLPSFETRGVKINGKCTAITRSLSQALSLQNNKSFLSNLETSAEIYERIAQGKQISKREEREVFAFSKLLNNFERQLDSATNSLPSNLMHNKVYKTFSDLSRDIAEIKGNFAIHLVTSNHVVAIYRTGSNYAYFDSNVAFVSGLKSVDQLMKIVEKAVEFAGYEVGEKGFLVEYFDVEQANKLLSSEGKQILAKEIKTERQLLAEQDKELGLIKINGQEVSRVQLYDFGTKINVEGSVPLLINADMNLSSKKFQDHLGKKEVSMTAREYLGNLKDSKNVEEVVQATKFIPFIGSKCEIEEAKQTRKPKQSLLELAKGIINCILAAVSLTSASWSKSQLPEKAGNEPQTYLNDPTVDKQLQRSRQTISS